MYKVADGLHEQERDVAKYWTNSNNERVGVCIAFLGFENQTKYDKDMPLRVIGYDGASYREQLSKDERYPVITMVLYFGNEHWGKVRSLFDAVEVPLELEGYVNDYHLNVFEIAHLTEEQIGYFKGDFGIVADFFVHRRTNPDYRPSDPKAFKHVDELLKLLSVITGDTRFESTLGDGKERPRNMCEVLDRVEARGRAEGRAEGFAEGQLEAIRSLMANMGMSAAQAMDALGICPDERETFEAMLAAK